MADIALIAAVAENGVIGAKGALPWHVPSDLRRFKALTMGKPMIMGRKTWESIGRALPGRETIVVARTKPLLPDGVHYADSPDKALTQARALGGSEIMIVGGADMYAAFIDDARRIYLTRIHARPTGDARFPGFDKDIWNERVEETPPPSPQDEFSFAFTTFTRRAA